MKAILEFDMDEPEDRAHHNRCTNATYAYLVFYDLQNLDKDDAFIRELRSVLKSEELTDEVVTLVVSKVNEMLEEGCINMNDLP